MEYIVKDNSVSSDSLIRSVFPVDLEHDSWNDIYRKMPPVLKHQLVSFQGREFAEIVKTQAGRLPSWFWSAVIDATELYFQSLQLAYNRATSLQSALDASACFTSFKNGSKLTQGQFLNLQKFCGGLAAAITGT